MSCLGEDGCTEVPYVYGSSAIGSFRVLNVLQLDVLLCLVSVDEILGERR